MQVARSDLTKYITIRVSMIADTNYGTEAALTRKQECTMKVHIDDKVSKILKYAQAGM